MVSHILSHISGFNFVPVIWCSSRTISPCSILWFFSSQMNEKPSISPFLISPISILQFPSLKITNAIPRHAHPEKGDEGDYSDAQFDAWSGFSENLFQGMQYAHPHSSFPRLLPTDNGTGRVHHSPRCLQVRRWRWRRRPHVRGGWSAPGHAPEAPKARLLDLWMDPLIFFD